MKRGISVLLGSALLCGWLTGCAGQETAPYGLDAARIQADTQYLCNEIGDRPTGTEKETAACDRLEGQPEGRPGHLAEPGEPGAAAHVG